MKARTNPWGTDNSLPLEKRDLSSLEAAILQTVAYSDVFDYPLTPAEIHRYLVGVRASWRIVQGLLDHGGAMSGLLVSQGGYFLIQGRDEIVETRRRRARVAAGMWPRAKRYGATIGQLPFVRMVAVTGALSMDNVEPDTDIDYLVVTEPGRLWLCRAMVVALVRLAARRGDTVCPNYFLSERTLALGEPNIFTAHELVQMVPIAGLETYRRMRCLNAWAARFLPNAFDAPRQVGSHRDNGRTPSPDGNSEEQPLLRSMAEAALRTSMGSRLEQWEMSRKVCKLSRQADPRAGGDAWEGDCPVETNFSADRCKGHFDSHRRRTLDAFTQRLRSLDVAFPEVTASGAESRSEGGFDA